MVLPFEKCSNSEENVADFDNNPLNFGGISLTNLVDECSPTDPVAPYQARMREWATTYLTASHPELGRDGPVCPFTASSISKNVFWVGCLDRPGLTAADIERTVANMVIGFRRLPPMTGADSLLKTILILFPSVADFSMIDDVQQRLKEESIPRGLMIGQFYPGCEEPGIRNPEFRPLQSPFALLAIRHIVSSDFPFLATRAAWVEDYLKIFAPAIPGPVRRMVAEKFDPQGTEALLNRAHADRKR